MYPKMSFQNGWRAACSVGFLLGGEIAALYVVDVMTYGIGYLFAEVGVTAQKTGREAGVEA